MTKTNDLKPRFKEGDQVLIKGHPDLSDTEATVAIDDGNTLMVKVYAWRKLKGYTHRNTWIAPEFVFPAEASA